MLLLIVVVGIVFIALYNQKVFERASDTKNAPLIIFPGLLEGSILGGAYFLNQNLYSSEITDVLFRAFITAVAYCGVLFIHLKNYSKVQKLSEAKSSWLQKQLTIRGGVIIVSALISSAILLFFSQN